MDQVFVKKKQHKTFKNYSKNEKKYWKSQGICQSGKVGTMFK